MVLGMMLYHLISHRMRLTFVTGSETLSRYQLTGAISFRTSSGVLGSCRYPELATLLSSQIKISSSLRKAKTTHSRTWLPPTPRSQLCCDRSTTGTRYRANALVFMYVILDDKDTIYLVQLRSWDLNALTEKVSHTPLQRCSGMIDT